MKRHFSFYRQPKLATKDFLLAHTSIQIEKLFSGALIIWDTAFWGFLKISLMIPLQGVNWMVFWLQILWLSFRWNAGKRKKPYNIVTTNLFALREGLAILVDYLVSLSMNKLSSFWSPRWIIWKI